MKVLLWQDIDKLGRRGEEVEVRDGFARNFLFPQRLASRPTPSMRKEFELEKRRQAKVDAKLISDANVVVGKLAQVPSVSIEVNTNEEGHLYGSVTPTMIAEALKDHGLRIEPKLIVLPEAIKSIGTYEATVRLHREVQPKLKVWVLSSREVKSAGATPEKPAEPIPGSPAK